MTAADKNTSATSKTAKESGFLGRCKSIAENAFVSAVVSAIISGGVLLWGTMQLENSKERVASLVRQQVEFDKAQSNVFSQLGLYTGKLFDKAGSEISTRDQLQSAIISAELQVNRLLIALPKRDHELLLQYANELGALSKSLRDVKSPNDLGPVYGKRPSDRTALTA
jgi:hypothetical protein